MTTATLDHADHADRLATALAAAGAPARSYRPALTRAAYEAGCAAIGVEPRADGWCARAAGYTGSTDEYGERHPGMVLAASRGLTVQAEQEAAWVAEANAPIPGLDTPARKCARCRRGGAFTTLGGSVCDDCA
jgi:hypothetical protein